MRLQLQMLELLSFRISLRVGLAGLDNYAVDYVESLLSGKVGLPLVRILNLQSEKSRADRSSLEGNPEAADRCGRRVVGRAVVVTSVPHNMASHNSQIGRAHV